MKILIVDGLNLFIRSFVVVPTMDMNGEPIGGITGFLKTLKNIVLEVAPSKIIVAWDGEGGSRRRRGIMKDYKEGRKVRLNREMDHETQGQQQANMGTQLSKLRDFLDLLGVLQIEVEDVEADDVIALLSMHVYQDVDKVILTSDNDMLQLIDDHTLIYSPTKKVYWGRDMIKEKIGVLAENYIYVKALKGDSSDNIKGLGGIGEKTAVKLFPFLAERPVTLEEIRQHAEANQAANARYKSVLEQWDKLLENIKLMQLSSPIISPVGARTVMNSADAKPKFMFTEFRLQLVRHGIQTIDPDTIGVFQAYRRRVEG